MPTRMRFIECSAVYRACVARPKRNRGPSPGGRVRGEGAKCTLHEIGLLEKSRPRALFSERQLRFRRQKARFLPPAVTRSYALAGGLAHLGRPVMLVGRVALLGQEALADAGGRV